MNENVNVISRNEKGTTAMVIVTNDQYPKGKTMHLKKEWSDNKPQWTDKQGRRYKI